VLRFVVIDQGRYRIPCLLIWLNQYGRLTCVCGVCAVEMKIVFTIEKWATIGNDLTEDNDKRDDRAAESQQSDGLAPSANI